MVFKFKEKIVIMAVGKSGVGKSTIGNFLLTGQAGAGDEAGFPTSTGVESCTQVVSWKSSKNCRYGDVPGIPDTKPENTRKFYNVIVNEARSALHVMLFVFKKDRIDVSAYDIARLLFREFQENSTVPKVLIINDHTNYGFNKPPTEDELLKQAKEIQRVTNIKFEAILYLNPGNMEEKLQDLLNTISSFNKSESPNLRTYKQLEAWVASIRDEKDLQADIVSSRQRAIDQLQKELEQYQVALATATAAAVAATIGAFFTFGATLGIATPTAAAATAAVVAIELKKAQLKEARASISTVALDQATEVLADAVKSFQAFKSAVGA